MFELQKYIGISPVTFFHIKLLYFSIGIQNLQKLLNSTQIPAKSVSISMIKTGMSLVSWVSVTGSNIQ